VQTPLHSESRLPERFGPDGPILNRMGSEKGENFWHHDRFGFQAGAIQPASDLREAECLIIPAMQWTMNILPVRQVDFEKNIVTLDKPCTYPIGIPHCAREGSIWFENSLSVLSPGHWVYHAGKARLYYCPVSGTPENNLEAGSLVELVRLAGEVEPGGIQNPVKGIHIRNLIFTRTNRYRFHGLTGKGIQHDWEMHDLRPEGQGRMQRDDRLECGGGAVRQGICA